MRTMIWRVLTITAGLVAAFTVVLLIVTERAGSANCEPAYRPCDIHGYFLGFYIGVGVVMTAVSLASCAFSYARSEAGPALGLLSSILLLGFVAGGLEGVSSWLIGLTWAVGCWLLIVSVTGLALLRGGVPR